jgi:hypothetical protein
MEKEKNSYKKWSLIEEKQLVDLYVRDKLTYEHISVIHKRSVCSIKVRLTKLGIKKRYVKSKIGKSRHPWSTENKNQLIKLYSSKKLNIKEIAFICERTVDAIKTQILKLKLPTNREEKGRSYKSWTDEEEKQLLHYYYNENLLVYDISNKLERTMNAITMKLKKIIKLKKEVKQEQVM